MTVRGLLIDLDGTLADSLPLMRRSYDRLLAHYGRTGSDDEFRRLNGPRLPEGAALLRETHGLAPEPAELLARWFGVIAQEYMAAPPSEGADALLRAAVEASWRVAVVTSSSADLAGAWLSRTGLAGYVATVVDGACVARGKPAPEPYLEALRRLDAAPRDCFAVEDTAVGATAALAAGVPTWGMEQQPGAAVSWPGGVRRLRRLDDLVPLLGQASLRWHRLAPDVVVTAEAAGAAIPADLRAAIEAVWAEGTARRPELFDGEILSLVSFAPERIGASLVPYRLVHARRALPHLAERIPAQPMAVSGITRCRNGLIFGQRSPVVSGSAGLWELAPAGSLDRGSLRQDGSVDLRAAIAAELESELGIGADAIRALAVEGAVENIVTRLWDVVIGLELTLGKPEVLRRHAERGSGEYGAVDVVPEVEVPAFCERVRWRLVDVTYHLLDRAGLLP